MVETPRERQIRTMLEGQRADVERIRVDTARQRRNEAKCKLVGHRWQDEEHGPVCLRCGVSEEELDG